jgi:hypothetical protein
MRKILACVCAIALLPAGVFCQAPGAATRPRAPSPLSQSIASAIAAVPLDPPVQGLAGDQDRDEASGWVRVEALQPGIEITLTVTGTPAVKALLLLASHDAVFVLRPGGPKLSGRVSRALVGVGGQWPAVFSGSAPYSLTDDVRVADGGIFDGGLKVADLAQAVQRTPREDVSEIRVAGHRKGNKLMAVVGAGGGFLLGAYIGTALAFKDCGGSCGDEKFLIGLSVVGLPVALGLLGYYGGSHTVGGMVYLAPPPTRVRLKPDATPESQHR